VALLSPAAASAARPLTLGFSDGIFTEQGGATWLQRSAAAGAQAVRINIGWDAPNTPAKPPGFDARNPADRHYDFSSTDAAIRQASRLGLRVLAQFTGAPQWAEGPGRPANVAQGTWEPSPQALEDYGVALGLRYSGHFPDLANPGHDLPRIWAFQPWNEPNLNQYLNPQWSGGRTAAPAMYRAMLNAFYTGLKSVDPGAVVVTAGTAPFGDPQPGGPRIMPVRFWRDALCVRAGGGGRLRGTGCPNPAHFDALAHDMYSWGTPETHALWPDDVAIPDMGKVTAVLRAAERAGDALPRRSHPLWVTEVGYNSNPPNPYGVPVGEEARWLAQTLAVLWSQGVSTVFWEQVGDQPPVPDFASSSQSGVYYLDGQPKPSLTAYHFPVAAWRASRSAVDVWGRTPVAGRVAIERLAGSRWKTIRVLHAGARATFMTQLPDRHAFRLRAQVGGQTSLVWNQR
jgi:hypothetical protein